MTNWPCHVWLQKKLAWPTNKAPLGCVTIFYAPIWVGDEILCTLSPDHNNHWENGQHMLYSQKVCQKCNSQQSGEINLLT